MKIGKLFEGVIPDTPGYCAWPTVVATGNGELLVVCSGGRQGHLCPYGRVLLYRSIDGGRTWTTPSPLSCGPLDDRDAGICRTSRGTLLVNWFTNILALVGGCNHDTSEWRQVAQHISLDTLRQEHGFWMKRSLDNGQTWSEKYSIPANNPHGATVLNDGSLLLVGRELSGSSGYQFEGSRLGPKLIAVRSEDDGLHWQKISELPAAPGHRVSACFEPFAVQMPDGKIIAVIRDQNHESQVETYQTESLDNGLTWSEPRCISAGYPPHLLKLGENRLLLSCGWRQKPCGIKLHYSSDGAKSWSEPVTLSDQGQNPDLGYPTTASLPDGSLFTLWYEGHGKNSQLKYCRWQMILN